MCEGCVCMFYFSRGRYVCVWVFLMDVYVCGTAWIASTPYLPQRVEGQLLKQQMPHLPQPGQRRRQRPWVRGQGQGESEEAAGAAGGEWRGAAAGICVVGCGMYTHHVGVCFK